MILCGLFTFSGLRVVRTISWPVLDFHLIRRLIAPVVFVALVSLVLLQSQPREFKIVMDEPVLMATALQMHELSESKTTAKAYEINGNFEILAAYIDKRPTLFPFIISQLHSLTGYRATQGFWLNALLSPVFLALLFYAGNLFGERWGGYLAVLLFSTVPLLAMNMCGSGFELLNLTLLLATALAAYGYLNQSSPIRADFLVFLGVLLAHTRYESALYVGAVGLVLCFAWWQQRQIQISWGLIVAPLLLISLPLRRIIHADNDLLWQLDEKGVTRPFSFDFLGDNLSHAFNFFYAHNLEQSNSLLLSVLFTISMFVLVGMLLSRRLRVDFKSLRGISASIFGAFVIFNVGLLMCYFWGQLDDVMATRIILPFILLQVILVVWVCAQIRWRWFSSSVVIMLAVVYFFAFSRPMMAQSNFLMSSTDQQEFQWTFDYIQSREESPILFISNRHLAALIQRRSGLIPETAIRNKLKIDMHLKLSTFSEILIIDFVPYASANLSDFKEEALLVEEIKRNFETETLVQEKLNNYGEMRVSRLLSVKMDPALRARADAETQDLFQHKDALLDFYQTLP